MLLAWGAVWPFAFLLEVVGAARQPGTTPSLTVYGFLCPLFLPLFPLGLLHRAGFVPDDLEFFSSLVWCVFGWAGYVLLTGLVLLQRRRKRYFIFYALLCLVLAFNVVGCHEVMPRGWLKFKMGC